MDWEYLHLITHAFPIVLSVCGGVVGLAGWTLGREELERWGLVALLIGAAFVVPAYLTGLAAADVEAERTFVEPSVVQDHRIAATWAAVPMLLAGILAAMALWEPDRRLRRFTLLVGLAAAGFMAWTAWLGAGIEHRPRTEGPAEAGGAPGDERPDDQLPAAAAVAAAGLLARARDLHRRATVVDGHNDLPWRVRGAWGLDPTAVPLDRRLADGHTDLPRLREGGVDVQFWSAWVPVRFIGPEAERVAREQIGLIRGLVERFPEQLELAHTTADVRRVVAEGRVASLIGVEGGHAIVNSLPVLRELYGEGARYLTLAHASTLAWVDAAGDEARHGGLTPFGRRVVREMNRLGMMVDLSHVSDAAMHAALDASRAPVIFSHSSVRALADHPRNVPDDVLRRLPENGGVVMVNFFSAFLTHEGARAVADIFRAEARLRQRHPEPAAFREAMARWYAERAIPPVDVGTVADHIEHVVRVAGVDHVGLGSDFDGVPLVPEGLEDVAAFPNVTAELLRRGHSEEDVRQVLGENLLRAMARVEAVADSLREVEAPDEAALPFRGLEPERGGPR